MNACWRCWISPPHAMLPKVHLSFEVYGHTNIGGKGSTRIPITGITEDQQAALYEQLCVQSCMAKNTYGTGCLPLMNTGKKAVRSHHGLADHHRLRPTR